MQQLPRLALRLAREFDLPFSVQSGKLLCQPSYRASVAACI
jgi:hypothetical protein